MGLQLQLYVQYFSPDVHRYPLLSQTRLWTDSEQYRMLAHRNGEHPMLFKFLPMANLQSNKLTHLSCRTWVPFQIDCLVDTDYKPNAYVPSLCVSSAVQTWASIYTHFWVWYSVQGLGLGVASWMIPTMCLLYILRYMCKKGYGQQICTDVCTYVYSCLMWGCLNCTGPVKMPLDGL